MGGGRGTVGEGVVARRRVFHIPGYDPFHPRRYRELYRREAAEQARVSGWEVALSRRGPDGWRVRAVVEGRAVEATFEVLAWGDIVRGSMEAGIAATYGQLARTAWTYAASGALWRLAGLRKGPVLAALYPVAVLLGQLALALGLGALAGRGALAGLGAAGVDAAGWGWALRVVVLAGVAAGMLRWFKRHDGRVLAHYLMHDFAFSARWGGANPPALEDRMAEWKGRIAAALASDADEVLVVGHSSGAHLAVSVLADLVRAGQVPDREAARRPALGLLSLGQAIPMVSFLPEARRLRADLALLAAQGEVAWVDVTAPGDGASFALCDPVAVSGVRPPGARWPLVISAAFSRTLSPERWRALRWRFFRCHFQYLCAFDRPGDFDYFRITAGPRTLWDRFAGRAPSRQAITRAASPHVSTAA